MGQVQNMTLAFSVTSHTCRRVSIKTRDKLLNRYQVWLTQFPPIAFFSISGEIKKKKIIFWPLKWKYVSSLKDIR